MKVKVASALFLVVTVSTTVAAQSGPIEWHGFLTEIVAAADEPVNYGPGITLRPDYSTESRLGLNLSAKISHKVNVASQFLAKRRDKTGMISADWAFLTYFPADGLSLRLGKQRAPSWLVSSYGDVGHEYPWIRPPIEVYGLNPFKSYTGVSAAYEFPLLGGDLEIQGAAGGETVEQPIQSIGDDDGRRSVLKVAITDVMGTTLKYTTDSLTLIAYRVTSKASISNELFHINKADMSFFSLGAKGVFSHLVAYAEYAKTSGKVNPDERTAAVAAASAAIGKVAQTHDPADAKVAHYAAAQAEVHTKSLMDFEGYYGTLGVPLGNFFPHLTYAHVEPPRNSVGVGEQSSITGGIRYDIGLMADVKFEIHHVKIPEYSPGLLNFNSEKQSVAELQHEFNVISLATDLIF